MKAKRFAYQQIRKQEKSIENEDPSFSYEGKRLVGEKEILESHQIGNLLLKMSKQQETVFNLSEQLRSILTQYEVINEKLDQLKTLVVTNKHITREKILIHSQQSSSQAVSMQIENPEYQQSLPQVYQQQISSIQEDKNKEFLKNQKTQKESLSRDKKKSSQKKMLIFQFNIALKQKMLRFQNLQLREEKRCQDRSQNFEQQEKELKEENILMSKLRESKLVNLPSKKDCVMEPCHVKLIGPPQSGQIPEGGKHLF